MKNIFNLLLVAFFILATNVGCKKTSDVNPSTSVTTSAGPLYCTVDTVYDFTNNNTSYVIRNNRVSFDDIRIYPTKHILITINNSTTQTGTFTVSGAQYTLGYADATFYPWATDHLTPVGSVTITTNTDTYMEGTYTFTAERMNATTHVYDYRIYKGTFGGTKN